MRSADSWFLWPVLTTLALYGCGSERRADPLRNAPRIVATEEIRIDGMVADLVPIRDVAVAPTGWLAVTQEQDHLIRFFDESGEPAGFLGRSGEGPGEFTATSTLGWYSDTLWVWDRRQKRATLIDPNRQLLRVVGMPARLHTADTDLARSFGLNLAAIYDEQRMLAIAEPMAFTALLHMRWDGSILKDVLRPTTAADLHLITVGSTIMTGDPFGTAPLWDVSPDGARIVVVRNKLEDAAAPTISLTVASPSGDTLTDREYPFVGRALTREVIDTVLASALPNAQPDLIAAMHDKAYVPPVAPPVRDVIAGGDGTIWLGLRQRSGVPREYVLLDARGEPIGTVQLPSNTTVKVATREWIWCLRTDPNDVQSLVKYLIGAGAES